MFYSLLIRIAIEVNLRVSCPQFVALQPQLFALKSTVIKKNIRRIRDISSLSLSVSELLNWDKNCSSTRCRVVNHPLKYYHPPPRGDIYVDGAKLRCKTMHFIAIATKPD